MREDRIIKKLIEHDEQLKRIREKLSKTATSDEVNQRFDETMTILKKLDQERIFTIEWVRNVEKVVGQHSKEITNIKQELKIA